MPSRRYYIAVAPVEHINGKMAPVRIKCPNISDPSEVVEVSGFWYGYRRQARPDVSRYAIRTICRNLQYKPYTTAETTNRDAFTAALEAVNTHRVVEGDWLLMLQDFAHQTRYPTPNGYAVAICREYGGVWPSRWISNASSG